MKEQSFNYTTLKSFGDGDMLAATYVPNLEIDIVVARELVRNRMAFSEGQPHYILIDFTNVKSATKEARDYMNSVDGGLKNILGGAFLSNNVVATLLINLYLKINRPVVPARFFTNKEEAVRWLTKVKSDTTPLPQLAGYEN